ncbi:MAG: winged helix-turn-helix transcriptional regulator [Rickettsiales bacterium]|nr:winged helix-turn-helix transcriptional regulator [Rickettsiales bacterium]
MSDWNFFTNHGHTLFLIATTPEMTVRKISTKVGITERSTLKIISDLNKDGYLKIIKKGRHNIYKITSNKHFKHDLEKECQVQDFIDVIKSKKSA